MKRIAMMISVFMLMAVSAFAKLRVVATYGYIGDITAKIGGECVEVSSLAPGAWDPHAVVPRPSFIARLRSADLVVINGAHLEIGWFPPLVKECGNGRVQPGRDGFLDLSAYVRKIQIPASVSRDHGDVHPDGNPHFALDPANVPLIADAISAKLEILDGANLSRYRSGNAAFKAAWQAKMDEWGRLMGPLRGSSVIEYHRLYDYFLDRYGLRNEGQIEPLPGIPPASRHLETLIQTVRNRQVKRVLQDVYHSPSAAAFIADKTGARVFVLPHDVGAVREAGDVVSLFDEIIRRIAQ